MIEKIKYIKKNHLFGFIYDKNIKDKKFIDNFKIYVDSEEKFISIGQIYIFEEKIVSYNEDDLIKGTKIYEIPNKTFMDKFDKKELKLKYSEFSENELVTNLSRYPVTIKEYYEKYLMATDEEKKKLQKEDRTFLLEMRSLKQFKFNQEKYSIEFRRKILEFTMLANADEKLNILDEETVREYDTLLENIKIDNKMKYYIEKDTYTMFLRNYTFYNHDYMADYTSITNMKRIETFDEKAFDFLLSRLYLTLELAFTEDGLGKENTPLYYALIKNYVSKVLKEIKNDDFLKIQKKIFKLEESLKWFKISENKFINFGDDNNYKISHKNFIIGQKHFKESGYFIYNSKNNTSFRLKYKTLSVMHTHCDDGSFIYTYEGQPIFIDPGLYKYEEKNSIRKYVRSYIGHNNISVMDKDFDAQKINSEIRKESIYKNFASDSFGKIKVIKDDWETEKKIKIQNNWFENIKINQNIEIKEENEIELTYKIISETTPKISILFNLDDIFNGAKIEFINNCELFVVHNKYKIQFKFSKKVNFTEKNGYKSYSLEEIIKIKKLIFYRNTKELNEEIKLNIKVTKSSLQEKNETEIIQGKKINYIYKKNNYKKLIIIFQSWSYTKEEVDRIIKDKVFRNSFQKKNSTKYSYYYFTKEKNLKADLLYIEDNNSYIAGWYILDKGENVVKKYNIFLDQFIKKNKYKKENIYTFGSSKGGYGALLYGLSNKNINNIIAIVPQIKLSTFMEYGWKKKIFEDFMLNNKLDLDEKEKIDNYLFNIKHKNKNINIYSGKGDPDKHILEFIEHLKKNSKNKINSSFSEDEKLNHTNLFRLYLPEAMKVLMEDKSKINKKKNKLWKKVFNVLNKMKSPKL